MSQIALVFGENGVCFGYIQSFRDDFVEVNCDELGNSGLIGVESINAQHYLSSLMVDILQTFLNSFSNCVVGYFNINKVMLSP